ncbi:MAG: DUF2334 domain-containing protein [Alicyclobacillaceae bacterium]|nr:DUF2334 domain-containing protein [Alicyclobacillaceae bacterium]
MKRRLLRWIRTAVVILLFIFIPVHTATSVYQELWPDHHHVALLRLEDVSPGPPYRGLEDLGRLRAVLDFLSEEKVPYQITVVPRYIGTGPSGQPVVYDIANPDSETAAFVRLLQQASSHGAVIGMHGYTHQFGTPDWRHPETITTIGREFDVPNQPVTQTTEYAATHMAASLHSFLAAGLEPGFWESPHYAATKEQEKVFRENFGILYEPDRTNLRSLKDVVPVDGRVGSGASLNGAVYVPTPLGYVRSDRPEQSIRHILSKASFFDGLGSVYFHPVLEFPFLEPVTEQGHPVWRDGLPVYRYKSGEESYLHQLIHGLQREGYVFKSLHQVVPIQPAWRYDLPGELLTVGRVTGGQADEFVTYDSRAEEVWVTPSARDLLRTSPQSVPARWLTLPPELHVQELYLVDVDGDGRDDLVIVGDREIYACRSRGQFFDAPRALPLPIHPGDRVITGRFLEGRPAAAIVRTSGTVDFYDLRSAGSRTPSPVRSIREEQAGPLKPKQWFSCDRTAESGTSLVQDLGAYDPQSGILTLYRFGAHETVHIVRATLPPGLSLVSLPAGSQGRQSPSLVGFLAADGRWMGWTWKDGSLVPIADRFGPWMSKSEGRLTAGTWGSGRPCVGIVTRSHGRLTVDTAIAYFGWKPFPDR